MYSAPKIFCQDGNLYIRWKQTEKSLECILFVAESNQYGKLFSVETPQEFYKLFSKLKKIPSSDETYLLLCQNGNLFMVITAGMGHLIHLCWLHTSIIWCGFVKVSGFNFLGACDKNGSMFFGKMLPEVTSPDYFHWYLCDLQSSLITFLHLDDHVVISNGNSSYCVGLKFTGSEVKCKPKRLPYFGIVDLSLDNKSVKLTACDGRTYTKTLSELLRSNHNSNTNRNLKNTMLPSIISGLKSNCEILNDNGEKLSLLNRYVEQINIAKCLLSKCSSDICNAKVNLEASSEREDSILIMITIDIADAVKLDFNWWQIRISLSEANDYENCTKICPVQHSNTGSGALSLKIPFTVTIRAIGRLLGGALRPKLNIFLALRHFVSGELICCVNICQKQLDALNFLTTYRLSVRRVSSRCFKVVSSPPPNTNYNGKQIFRCTIFTDKNRLLRRFSCVGENNIRNGHLQLWYLDTPVNFIFKKQAHDVVEIEIEATDNTLLIVLKYGLQLRLCSHSPAVRLTEDLRREGHFCKRIIEVETSTPVDSPVVNRLYQFMTNYFSKVVI